MTRRSLAALGMTALLGMTPGGEAEAAAGEFLFSLNRVEVERGDATLPATRGLFFEAGDTVRTGPTGYAQLRFRDGALLMLRPGAALKIEDFALPEAETIEPARPAAAPLAVPGEPQSLATSGRRAVLRLLKGALRTATGLIGKRPHDNYRVISPAATLGIRGTDYSMALCQGDCPRHADGLYVGVSSGAIVLTNDVSQIVLRDGESAYVKDSSTPIEQKLEPPEILEMPISPVFGAGDDADAQGRVAPGFGAGERAASPRRATPGESHGLSYVASAGDPDGVYELPPVLPARRAAYGTGSFALATANEQADAVVPNGVAGANLGFDPASGLRWGRWTGGAVAVNGVAEDFTVRSLHWIVGPESYTAPALPVTGTRTYTLAGNTNPTDQNGNVGVLGSASFDANFSAMTVSSTLDLGINGQLWQASGSGSIAGATGLFGGSYAVTVDSVPGASGAFSGFFTPDAAGAGLGFSLTDGITSVSGAAAFNDPTAP